MSSLGSGPSLFGIRLCGVTTGGQVIGTIRYSPTHSLTSLRRDLAKQGGIAESIFRGKKFAFLNPNGFKVEFGLESLLKVDDIANSDSSVNICVQYDKPCIGIKFKCGDGIHIANTLGCLGDVKGFVYCDFSSTVVNFIEEIRAQLPDLYEVISKFKLIFLDLNGWPISKKQEDLLTVVEMCVSSCVTICLLQVSSESSFSNDKATEEKKLLPIPQNTLKEESIRTSPSSLPTITQKVVSLTSVEDRPTFEILLSYVHTEAEKYACLLKGALEVLGYSVFLDVHCIKGGDDWQDVLNDAIANCTLFVPLITMKYGRTLWTNREVKLADILGKMILPINFNEMWPPKTLAIQFATTQYIPGNKYLTDTTETPDSFTGDVASMLAGEIVGKYKRNALVSSDADEITRASPQSLGDDSSASSSASLSSYTVYKEPKIKSYASSLPKCVPKDFRVSAHESKEGIPLVVVSCCVEQVELAKTLTVQIKEKGYDVWCSCSVADQTSEQRSVAFQDKADIAAVIIFVLSTEFAEDTFCEQQVYYCEHRKRIIPLVYEPFEMPDWMATYIGSSTFVDYQSVNYLTTLKDRIDTYLNPAKAKLESKKLQQQDEELASLCMDVKQKLPKGNLVYVCGGSRFYSKNGKNICREVGKALAKDENIILVTGGFLGVGETVGRSFFEEREQMQAPHGVCHMVAVRDDQDLSSLTRQNPDRTFSKVPYGDTIFCGNSVRQREMLTARVTDLCILIEGGPGAAFMVQQYVWNGNLVVPVGVTGGTASGMFNAPASIFECPASVSKSDWSVLSDSSASVKEVASAVCRIIKVLTARHTNGQERKLAESP